MIRLRGFPAVIALVVSVVTMIWLWMAAMSGPPEPRVAYAVAFGLAARGILDWIGSWFVRSQHDIQPQKRDKPERD